MQLVLRKIIPDCTFPLVAESPQKHNRKVHILRMGNFIDTLKCILESGDEPDVKQYRQLWKHSVLLTIAVSIIPVIILLLLNNYQYHQYKKALKKEMIQEVSQISLSVRQSVKLIFQEYELAINSVFAPFLSDIWEKPNTSELLLQSLAEEIEGIVGVSVRDSQGKVIAQAGSSLKGDFSKEMKQKWMQGTVNTIQVREVLTENSTIPFFHVSLKHAHNTNDFYIVTITITSPFDKILFYLRTLENIDIFIVNSQGSLLTDSRFYGKIGARFSHVLPHLNREKKTFYETTDFDDHSAIVNSQAVKGTPFHIIVVRQNLESIQQWSSLNKKLLILFGISMFFGFFLILSVSSSLVCRIRKADRERIAVIQNVEIEHINKLASIGRLSSGVAHEINNPLAIINEQAGLMKDIISLSEGIPEKENFMDIIGSIDRSIKRCSTITHRLLSFAKHFDVKIENINLSQVIEDIINFIQREAIYRNITLTHSFPDKPPIIESDRGQLEQVFLNLINNAFDAVSDGGLIDISIQDYENEASKSTVSTNGYFAVTVSDNGEGIAERHLNNIFEPFFTTKKAKGTGLGLSITYGIVEKLGGRIEVNSTVNKGTRFTVILPKKRPHNGGNNGNIEGSTSR
jgi:two-component system NtrC family sensor kinase